MKTRHLLIVAGLLCFTTTFSYAEKEGVPFPEGYRNWLHAKSMLIQPGHALENPFQGLHHIYANGKAANGLKSGKYADGSVLVFDLLKYEEKDLTIQEGERKLVGVMHKDSVKYASTGGWGFEGFAANSKTERLVKDGGKSCFGCHEPQKAKDYVFSELRE
ncbi:MAG: cytochrome P460 family protein [Methyloglobulus sp.]|uniref:cytochrome P460 family protein n=1 Tax=Methyloglobulus sp. TaxID=2518622 RepID=UPI00184D5745|nr:cytochrome P460 family protein [Methyloglobulus sp.]